METNAMTKQRLQLLRDALLSGLVERDVPVRLALLAALAGEHVLLLGPPGTAKSEIARRLRLAFRDATWFERLLTRFSVPEELFGPLSIKALENDRYLRQTEHYLPTAQVAFLDEIFKANSAILNSLLTLLNERQFDNGTTREDTPLICVVAASNELPQDEGMEALYDRFLLRCHVGPVSESAFPTLLDLRGDALQVPDELRLSTEDLEAIRKGAASVTLGADIVKLLAALRKHLIEQQIDVSDRRWRKITKLLRTSAFTDGRAEVTLWDAWLLQHCTWSKPQQIDVTRQWYEAHVGAAQSVDPAQFVRLTEAFEKKLQQHVEKEEVACDAEGRALYIGPDGETTHKKEGVFHEKDPEGHYLYSWPSNVSRYGLRGQATEGTMRTWLNQNGTHHFDLEVHMENEANWAKEERDCTPQIVPFRWDYAVIARRVEEVRAERGRLAKHVETVAARLASLSATIDGHVWIEPGFSRVARPNLEATLKTHSALLLRWDALEKGFAGLPQSEG